MFDDKRNKFHKSLVSNLPEPESIIRKSELCSLLGRSTSTIERWVKNKLLPEPVRHKNGRLIGWRRGDVYAYLKSL